MIIWDVLQDLCLYQPIEYILLITCTKVHAKGIQLLPHVHVLRVTMNLLICGDFTSGPFVHAIENPHITRVQDVKETIAETAGIPAKELSLYYQDEPMPEDKPLVHFSDTVKSVMTILVLAEPLRITVQRYNSDINVHVQIPRLEAL